ncbi:MAG TPA: bi-domain-containing oxidoreductase [Bryobacteraceae bacterium]|nr:bi-domain-containing oxidoreductase [Bryobacteraceae bacterium]
MRQVLRRGFKDIVVDEVPDPVLRPQHVLIRPVCTLISSGTEMASIHQEGVLREVAGNPSHLRKVWDVMRIAGPMRTLAEVRAKFSDYAELGYSGAGILVEKDPAINELDVGDRVSYGGEYTGHSETVVAGRNLVVRLPETVPFEQGAFTTLGSIAMNAVRIAEIGLGDTVAVIGLGLVGQLIAQLVRAQGGVAIGLDLRPERIELARKLGAAHGVEAGAGAAAAVRALTGGRGADCVIIAAAAKSDGPARQAVELCRDRGRIVVVGAVELNFPWDRMYYKEIRVLMSRAYGPGSNDTDYEKKGRDYPVSYVRWTERRNMEEFQRLVAGGVVSLSPLISHRLRLEEAASAYALLFDRHAQTLGIVLRYGDAAEAEAGAYKPRRTLEISPRAEGEGVLGVALAGAGNLARWAHLPNLAQIPNVSLRAVYSSSGVRGKSYAKRFGAAYCTSEYDVVLKDEAVKAVLIASRNQDHAAQAVAALGAGKHVFLEKPMALTEEECRSLYRAVEESGRQLTVGFNRRFAPDYMGLKRALALRAGPAVIHCRVNSPGISGAYWMADPSIGGAILGEACHFVDLMYWLLGSEPVEVSAFSLPRGSREPIGENNIAASFRFADGSVGNLTYCTVGSATSGGERVEVFAQGVGAMTEDFKRLAIAGKVRSARSRWFAEKGYAAQMRAFLDGIREGKPPEVTVRDGARATLACLRMLEAARTRGVVPITLDEALR